MNSKRIFREPLIHFLLIGAALFLLFGWLNHGESQGTRDIVVAESRIQDLVVRFERMWRRSPEPAEVRRLIDSWVREEILYREGVAMGLDRDDPVVRQRIVRKMEFLADAMAADYPGEEPVRRWFAQRADEYRIPAVYSLNQVYLERRRHGDKLRQNIATLRDRLMAGEAVTGDASLLPDEVIEADEGELARIFGEAFASRVSDLPVGEWVGPVESSYGVHLVRVSHHRPARQPALEEVRAEVARDFMSAQNEEALEIFYRQLRERYTVRIEDGFRLADGR